MPTPPLSTTWPLKSIDRLLWGLHYSSLSRVHYKNLRQTSKWANIHDHKIHWFAMLRERFNRTQSFHNIELQISTHTIWLHNKSHSSFFITVWICVGKSESSVYMNTVIRITVIFFIIAIFTNISSSTTNITTIVITTVVIIITEISFPMSTQEKQ